MDSMKTVLLGIMAVFVLVVPVSASTTIQEYTSSGNFVSSHVPAVVLGPYWWDNFYLLNASGITGNNKPYEGDHTGDNTLICDSSHAIVSGFSSPITGIGASGIYTQIEKRGYICLNDSADDCSDNDVAETPLNASAGYLTNIDAAELGLSGCGYWPSIIYTTTPQAYVGFAFYNASAWGTASQDLISNAINWVWDNKVS